MDENSSTTYTFDDSQSIETELTGGVCKKGKRGEPKIKSGMYTIRRRDKTDGKMKRVHLFNTSDYRNTYMVNAVTGIPYNGEGETWKKFKMGSQHEDSIFKVKFLTREHNIPGLVLCYDSPEQYERHTLCTISQEIKNNWEEKNLYYRQSQKTN
jgi:hypothetical protein